MSKHSIPPSLSPGEQLILEEITQIRKHLIAGQPEVEAPYMANEVCRILKINRRTLDRRIKNGIIKAVRHGNTTYIHRAELRRYLSSNPQTD